jgi:hypothetical protein
MEYVNHNTNALMHQLPLNDIQKKAMRPYGAWITESYDHVVLKLALWKIALLFF